MTNDDEILAEIKILCYRFTKKDRSMEFIRRSDRNDLIVPVNGKQFTHSSGLLEIILEVAHKMMDTYGNA